MEFLDEDARPRFMFQSGAPAATESQPYEKPTKPFIAVTVAISSIFFALAIFVFQSEPYTSILIWFALSLLIGPFAPSSITGGDFRVGRGHVVNFPDQDTSTDDEDVRKRSQQRRSKPRRSEDVAAVVVPAPVVSNGGASKNRNGNGDGSGVALTAVVEETEWNEDDIEILKKQMVKHPVGKPGRWEAIAEAFGGRHKAESVVKKAKNLGEKKVDDSDSYDQFLKKRKALDKRLVEEGGGEVATVEKGESVWSSNEDIALLNALKAFPKDVAMRWEKVAAAVPGKSKAACMKRIAELKKGFRTAKSGSEV
ncbi:DnaJ subfamily c member 2-like protein [Trifolium pratense]|uniref:DnaJ subfamily c member 2-like protein n=1 Tax=Trifolium pratense TaxID=57577 RepID=A0A2K3NSH6_TRIPR|nr:DnaJ subfamily c member 2-like protein [Trifolium pratense]